MVTLVGKSWDLHVREVIETTLDENLAMIEDSVAYLKRAGKELVYDAEHFFDGWKANRDYALATLAGRGRGGADFVVLCDTNGGTLPWEVEAIVAEVASLLATQIGIHTHDDAGCGVANTLAAVRAGAVMVQGTINGYGERVANANLTTIIPDLQLKMGRRCVAPERLRELTELSRYVAEVANIPHDDYFPYVGSSAFAHKGGIHVAAVLKCPESYQHIDPDARSATRCAPWSPSSRAAATSSTSPSARTSRPTRRARARCSSASSCSRARATPSRRPRPRSR